MKNEKVLIRPRFLKIIKLINSDLFIYPYIYLMENMSCNGNIFQQLKARPTKDFSNIVNKIKKNNNDYKKLPIIFPNILNHIKLSSVISHNPLLLMSKPSIKENKEYIYNDNKEFFVEYENKISSHLALSKRPITSSSLKLASPETIFSLMGLSKNMYSNLKNISIHEIISEDKEYQQSNSSSKSDNEDVEELEDLDIYRCNEFQFKDFDPPNNSRLKSKATSLLEKYPVMKNKKPNISSEFLDKIFLENEFSNYKWTNDCSFDDQEDLEADLTLMITPKKKKEPTDFEEDIEFNVIKNVNLADLDDNKNETLEEEKNLLTEAKRTGSGICLYYKSVEMEGGFSDSSSNILTQMQGYLTKVTKSNSLRKLWYICLNHELLYFKSKDSAEYMGVHILNNIVVEVIESHLKDFFCFQVVFSNKIRKYYCESKVDLNHWVEVFSRFANNI